MNTDQIKAAVTAGLTVNYRNTAYHVTVDKVGQWFIVCTLNNSRIGLTWLDGVTLNGSESEFFINYEATL